MFKSAAYVRPMVSKAAWTYRGGAGAIGSGAQQDPDTVQPSCLTGQEEGSLSPRRRRIHSSSCSQQHLHTAGDKDNQGTEKMYWFITYVSISVYMWTDAKKLIFFVFVSLF